ncbi:Glyoxalase-like domain-containing protein [Friedmanniella luteola]|uniref:Glyoxalase-like domain-containing protein n=1 Tax=Friedmanniella luteola TaxID=546871 RepID=A0A1H1RJK7_9ACTN|nr:VOC family protein [Friedmanniella luteola]SDS35843.1 Glyoxalase-like domain-containing protein [Friedmanniella luteola]
MGLSEHKVEVVIAVSDLDQARAFYEDQLGLRLGPRQDVEDQGVRYTCAAGTGIFVYLSPDNAGKSSATLAGWFVDDLDETMTDLSSRGVTFEHYDLPGISTDARGVFDDGRLKAAWVKDPDGNTIALTELST